jgi:hypothetical protein
LAEELALGLIQVRVRMGLVVVYWAEVWVLLWFRLVVLSG